MNIRKLLTLILPAVIITACGDDSTLMPETPKRTLQVPVELCVENPQVSTTRLTGDPGVDDRLPAPTHLYLFAWMKLSDGNFELFHTTRQLEADRWEYEAGADGHDDASRYRLLEFVPVYFTYSRVAGADGDAVGRTYAVATTRALTQAQLISIVGTAHAEAITRPDRTLRLTTSPDAALRAAIVDLADAGNPWTSSQYRDLYSTPADDAATDANGLSNGAITLTSAANQQLSMGDVRLYHAAAKIDFTWEVDEALRPATAIESITVNELPTQCKIFAPAQNPAGSPTTSMAIDGSNPDAPINPGNKWIGRQYIYALQPSTADINYRVTFEGGRAAASRTFDVTNPNTLFTGWYRIIATAN